jgi:CDP-6-deoxy-D-xylo-4-hexulose-3-dehydrase
MMHPLMKNNVSREDLDLVIEHLKKDDPKLTNGPLCAKFEEEWSDWLGVDHSVFVNSGSSANLLSLTCLKLRYPKGGEVIVSPLNWVSDISAIIQTGFKPVFVDIDLRTLSLDNEKVIEAITNETRAVLFSHIQGFDGYEDDLLLELEKRDIKLIEDVCESHGATHNRQPIGSFGWMSNFSFYYAHHMTTIEGGMISTNDRETYENLRMLRSHGMVRESTDEVLKRGYKALNPELNEDFIFFYPSYNMRNTEIGAIIGSNQLKRLENFIVKRWSNQALFLNILNDDIYKTDFKTEGSSNYAFNCILKEPDDYLMKQITNRMDVVGIEYRKGSAGGGNQLRQPYLKNIMPHEYWKKFPNTEHVHFYGFYVGNYPTLKSEDIIDLAHELNLY